MSSTPQNHKRYKKNDGLHVCIFNNPISSIISRLTIDAYAIEVDKIIVVSMRKVGTLFIHSSSTIFNKYWCDNFFKKLLSINLKGFHTMKKITKTRQNFIVYAPWASLTRYDRRWLYLSC